MTSNVWSEFTRKIYIKAPAEKIYWNWATSRGIETWFLRTCEYIDDRGVKRGQEELAQPGDRYTWFWHNWHEGSDGMIKEANGRNHLVFSFSGSEVILDLDDSDHDKTLVSLHQRNIPTDEEHKMNVYYGCGTGWTFWLTNLKAYLEHDVTLHHTEPIVFNGNDAMEFINL